MIVFVSGGAKNGKSGFAQNLAVKLAGEGKRYYVATMIPVDEEDYQRIRRHVADRAGLGFETIECSSNIDTVAGVLPEDGSAVMLLECMSNLVANEMFGHSQAKSAEEVTAKLLKDIQHLASKLSQLVIITNNVSEDGTEYDSTTMAYIKAISDFNVRISEIADRVVEVVVGIPIVIKE